jgi:hypothetical protein
MTTTLLAPSMRLANEAIAKRMVAKVRDHSPAPGLLTLDRWELAESSPSMLRGEVEIPTARPQLVVRRHDICPSQGVRLHSPRPPPRRSI